MRRHLPGRQTSLPSTIFRLLWTLDAPRRPFLWGCYTDLQISQCWLVERLQIQSADEYWKGQGSLCEAELCNTLSRMHQITLLPLSLSPTLTHFLSHLFVQHCFIGGSFVYLPSPDCSFDFEWQETKKTPWGCGISGDQEVIKLLVWPHGKFDHTELSQAHTDCNSTTKYKIIKLKKKTKQRNLPHFS